MIRISHLFPQKSFTKCYSPMDNTLLLDKCCRLASQLPQLQSFCGQSSSFENILPGTFAWFTLHWTQKCLYSITSLLSDRLNLFSWCLLCLPQQSLHILQNSAVWVPCSPSKHIFHNEAQRGPTDRRTDVRTARWMDGWTDGRSNT